MKARVAAILAKLEGYPAVSGVKHLLHAWKGHLRVRTGDWRIIFTVQVDELRISAIVNTQIAARPAGSCVGWPASNDLNWRRGVAIARPSR